MFMLSDDDIRQTDGFKNVSLGNVLAVAYSTQKEKLTFLAEEDKVCVGLCELVKMGSKLDNFYLTLLFR